MLFNSDTYFNNCKLYIVNSETCSSRTTRVFRMQPRGTVQKISSNFDFLYSAPWVTYRELQYHSK